MSREYAIVVERGGLRVGGGIPFVPSPPSFATLAGPGCNFPISVLLSCRACIYKFVAAKLKRCSLSPTHAEWSHTATRILNRRRGITTGRWTRKCSILCRWVAAERGKQQTPTVETILSPHTYKMPRIANKLPLMKCTVSYYNSRTAFCTLLNNSLFWIKPVMCIRYLFQT